MYYVYNGKVTLCMILPIKTSTKQNFAFKIRFCILRTLYKNNKQINHNNGEAFSLTSFSVCRLACRGNPWYIEREIMSL